MNQSEYSSYQNKFVVIYLTLLSKFDLTLLLTLCLVISFGANANQAETSITSQQLWNQIQVRDVPSDRKASELVKTRLPNYGDPAGILIDSGGPHSIAIAVTLAENGFQPIFKMKLMTGWGQYNTLVNIQDIGAMKFYAVRMAKAKANLTKDSPPAFILDAHRTGLTNSSEFPTSEEFLKNPNLVWITEARDYKTNIVEEISIQEVMQWETFISSPDATNPNWIGQYLKHGIKILQHQSSPYLDNTPKGFISMLQAPEPPSCLKFC